MGESRTYGSVRGARDETRVPTATMAMPRDDAIIFGDLIGKLDALRLAGLISGTRPLPKPLNRLRLFIVKPSKFIACFAGRPEQFI